MAIILQLFQPIHEGPSNGSGEADPGLSPKANRDLISLNDDGDGHFPAGVVEHYLQILDVGIDVDKSCPFSVGHPGLRAVWSPVGAVDDNSFAHLLPLHSCKNVEGLFIIYPQQPGPD